MKFKELLSEKNISFEELPQSIKNKIEKLQTIDEKIKNYESSGIKENEIEKYESAKKVLTDLDRELEKTILKFNPEVYKSGLIFTNKSPFLTT
jgi:hypothetical protein